MNNKTLIQFFEWYLPADGQHWNRAAEQAVRLRDLGITDVWLPPAYKGQAGREDVGYGVYDLYDLGEFEQKGTVPTKYGTRDEYLMAIHSLHKAGLGVLADIVLNHRMGADEAEDVQATMYAGNNRTQSASGQETVRAWTKFTFPGRGGKYSDFVWDHNCFDGVDWDDRRKNHGVYGFAGKGWDGEVDSENGNYDYLMGADLDMSNQAVRDELDRWGKWYLETTGVDGVRIDAVKHIGFSYFTHWLGRLRQESGKEIFAVGEYWKDDVGALRHYLDQSQNVMSLFDVPLHFNFCRLSCANGGFDLSRMFANTLVGQCPDKAVTFVDNHDTQPGQALSSFTASWCKQIAYACILLRRQGIPCVFYGDLYGIPHDGIQPVVGLEQLLKARKDYAYGNQTDYLDDVNVIGWTRAGDEEHPGSGMAVVLTDCGENSKSMSIGEKFSGKTFVDCLGNRQDQIVIGSDGWGKFPVNGGSVSVWVEKGV